MLLASQRTIQLSDNPPLDTTMSENLQYFSNFFLIRHDIRIYSFIYSRFKGHFQYIKKIIIFWKLQKWTEYYFFSASFRALNLSPESNKKRAESWMLCFDKSKESPICLIILRRFLVIFLTPTFISFTKLKIRWSFWGAEQV